MIKELILGLGIIGLIILILMIALLPLICTIILGTYIATTIGLTGIVWWAFVILFYIIIMGIISLII
ncbi:MAG: hypothetical protein J6Y78_11055 [Paludibacteraceae bacterium]|nr:hypothetical protein [Paludibacteraceae bacterium]